MCRKFNFSIIPPDMKTDKPVKKFKLPQVRRGGYTWYAEGQNEDENYSDDEFEYSASPYHPDYPDNSDEHNMYN